MAWDGFLPLAVWLIPSAVELLLPNQRGAIEVTAVVLPIVALLFRYYSGKRQIETNGCGALAKWIQFVLFCVALCILLAIDTLMVLSHIMPKDAILKTAQDWMILGLIGAAYFSLMAIAMYPGRRSRGAGIL